jgi:hypothetical protein
MGRPKASVSSQRCEANLARGWCAAAFWYVPAIGLVVGLMWTSARYWLWTPAFLVIGLACLVNARLQPICAGCATSRPRLPDLSSMPAGGLCTGKTAQ